jgi:hypothetical protein
MVETRAIIGKLEMPELPIAVSSLSADILPEKERTARSIEMGVAIRMFSGTEKRRNLVIRKRFGLLSRNLSNEEAV